MLVRVNSSDSRNVLMDWYTDEVKGKVIISNFSSWMSQQRQALQVANVWRVDEIILSVTWDMSFNSSITICKISGTSCWLFQLKGNQGTLVILLLKALRKLEGSTGFVVSDEEYTKLSGRSAARAIWIGKTYCLLQSFPI